MSNKLEYLIIHCTATPYGRAVTKEDIEKWHIKERGWKKVGYSDMIHQDGKLENLIPFNQDDIVDPWEISNGAAGYNAKSRHVVYVGGSSRLKNSLGAYSACDTRTPQQTESLGTYIRYMILRHPNIKVLGHNQVANKSCPSFNVPQFLSMINIHPKNIF